MTHPRLLLLDMTPIAGAAATSTLKQAYFGGWRPDALLQITDCGNGHAGIAAGAGPVRVLKSNDDVETIVEAFKPQTVLYRPVGDSPAFHDIAMKALAAARARAAGLVIWLMDDWPARLETSDPSLFARLDADLRSLIASADKCFAISEGMAAVFGARYGAAFEVAHNGVDPKDWPERPRPARETVLIRYAGSLAPDTTRDAVFGVARAVSKLAAGGVPIAMEGRTHIHWLDREGAALNAMTGVRFEESKLSAQDYRRWLSEADILLVAYNFDPATQAYLQYSFANKTPETMAAGAAILAYGPEQLETIAYLKRAGAAHVVTDPALLEAAIAELARDKPRREKLAAAARAHAFSAFRLSDARRRFHDALRRCAAPGLPPDTEGEAGEKLQFDECGFVFDVLNAEETPGVMLDVGAHVGGSLLPYARAGWRVHAFEPDPVNREQLLSATAAMENVHVDARAVGAKAAANVPFYRSSVSSGISGLSSFHESHERSGAVSVTTLTDYMSAAGLAGADFLKIDVEGHEMAVLDGFDLAGVRPRAIVAEFEDGKTASHGYVMADLANLFVKAGYAVLVSEWRPIEEYGRTHSWRRLLAYPCEIAPEAWGNLIALREPPEEARLAAAFAGALKGGRAGEGAGALVRRYGAPETPSLYRRGVSFLTAHAPAAARLAGPPMRALRKFLRGSNRRAS